MSPLMSLDAAKPHVSRQPYVGNNMLGIMQQLNMWTKMNKEVLMPVSKTNTVTTEQGEFELMSAIVDSGPTVPVVHPKAGKAYELTEPPGNQRG